MTLVINALGDNPQQPMAYAETYIPDQLIAGNLKLVTQGIVLGAGTLPRGSVLGLQSGTPTVTAALVIGNGPAAQTGALAMKSRLEGGGFKCG